MRRPNSIAAHFGARVAFRSALRTPQGSSLKGTLSDLASDAGGPRRLRCSGHHRHQAGDLQTEAAAQIEAAPPARQVCESFVSGHPDRSARVVRCEFCVSPCVQFWAGSQSLLLTSGSRLIRSARAIPDLGTVGADFGEALRVKRTALDHQPRQVPRRRRHGELWCSMLLSSSAMSPQAAAGHPQLDSDTRLCLRGNVSRISE
jgi:hypothetical protein